MNFGDVPNGGLLHPGCTNLGICLLDMCQLRDLLFWEGFDLGCVQWGICRLGYAPIGRCGNWGLQILIAEYKLWFNFFIKNETTILILESTNIDIQLSKNLNTNLFRESFCIYIAIKFVCRKILAVKWRPRPEKKNTEGFKTKVQLLIISVTFISQKWNFFHTFWAIWLL